MSERGYKKSVSSSGYIFLTLVLFLPSLMLQSQQSRKEQLQSEKLRIEEEMRFTTQLLEETQKNKRTSLDQLLILRKRISDREMLIQTVNREIEITEEKIARNNEIITELTRDLEHLKDEYARMVYYAYKNRNAYDRLMFIFSAEDFNQAFRRMKYFQQYSLYRKTQAGLIIRTRDEIATAVSQLEEDKRAKLSLLQEQQEARRQLDQEIVLQDQSVQDLSSREKELRASLKEKESAALNLQKEIERIIAEEIRLAANKAGTTPTGTYALTPEELALSNDFQSNKGRLPWPLERGIISSGFGEHNHPVLKNVKTRNNGINILTEPDSRARAVFSGTVTRVMTIPNYNFVVMIRHGEYLSVYSNLNQVEVENGQSIATKQVIGRVFTDSRENKTELHFELWKGKELLDPQLWLAGTSR
ncbi:MAG: peptidoglycan DD-metalloendopeptidase family protein [Bacteroidales bacterium]|nr:peptidoglycan DD-metalloendopeptidase family protein [Bacteroidales bacterium]